jgi:pimeloyl-ACP methyl ester carboxylesterase
MLMRFILRCAVVVGFCVLWAAAAPNLAVPGTKTELGTLNGVHFRIDVPQHFTGGLVLYCHGFDVQIPWNRQPLSAPLQVFLRAGFAVAESQYRGTGWNVQDAIEDSEALRQYFIRHYGVPHRVIVAGHSMGGLVAVALIETDPEHFQGALPLCGALGSSYNLIQRRNFDPLVLFDYYYPGALGPPDHLPAGFVNSSATIARLARIINRHPERAAILTRYLELRSPQELPGMIAFYARLISELEQRAGGNPFNNTNTIYDVGPESAAVNRGVRRYHANPAARRYLLKYYTPSGELRRPVLAVHTLNDPLVPIWATNDYGTLVREKGRGYWFVQRWVPAYGHCAISARQTQGAFQSLLHWMETGDRAEPGEQP